MEEIKERATKNKREKTIAFVYVCVFFVVTTVICCVSLVYYQSSDNIKDEKTFAISKMDRIRSYQDMQSQEMKMIDSLYNLIKVFNPDVNASYVESDIKFYITDLKNTYNKNSHDGRYKIFLQVSNFYNMWFNDKMKLWAKRKNIGTFKQKLEECEIGLQKKIEELKSSK